MSRLFALAVAAALIIPAANVFAHDIPRDVTVHAFVRPDGGTLRMLFRVPLKSIMDVEYPRREREYVDLSRVDRSLREAARYWVASKVELYEGDALTPGPNIISARVSLESDPSFASYDQALAHVLGPPLPNDTTIFWEQGLLDVLFEYPIQSDRSNFSIHMGFDRLGLSVVTALRFVLPDGVVRAFELTGDAGLVRLDPSMRQAMSRFVSLGFFHILDGADHLLFLLCLVIPFRRIRSLVSIVTSFTAAHSLTLIASAYNYAPGALWFQPLIEVLIATSIVFMALENIIVSVPRRRWIVSFFFGLVHGFGFSFGLQHTMQFAGSHLLTSLLSFNFGVELGQLFVLLLLVPSLGLLFQYAVAGRTISIILSSLVAHTGWHWMADRYEVLRQFPWPDVTVASLAAGLRWLMLLVALAAIAWVLSRLKGRPLRPLDAEEGEL